MSDNTNSRNWRSALERIPPAKRHALLAAIAALVLVLLWVLAISPALATLRKAPAQRAALQGQAQQMQQLAAEAQQLKTLPRMDAAEAQRALEQSVQQRLGTGARISVAGGRATVTLNATPAAALAAWLTDARLNARAVPLDAKLQRGGAADAPTWSGTLSMALPAS
ncbi:MAG: type II secretion system protein M [Ottowia sp.]|nr:type II secretion system protein M [Ottowia sp.]